VDYDFIKEIEICYNTVEFNYLCNIYYIFNWILNIKKIIRKKKKKKKKKKKHTHEFFILNDFFLYIYIL